ncbi:SMI1/KNR4 family protein [Bacillus subtilis]|uniref:SMI1/KNR4 family protein n=1 Tax=Bacillus subtilis TaxID=1423 RepID=UPI002958D940|nr:SMI1/KNR4 family protein [Bacillus subtilis]
MVEWDFGEHPVSNEEIIEVENLLQVKFPKNYLEYVKIYSGAIPSPETFDLEDREKIAFGYLHSFHKESESYTVNVSNRYRDGRMPDKVIPIADDVFGMKSASIIV